MTTLIDAPEMEATHYGVQVAWLGEEWGEALIALGHHDTRRILAAFNRHTRHYGGLTNLADDPDATAAEWADEIQQRHAFFRKPDPEEDEDPDWRWVAYWCEADNPNARPVTLLRLEA
ncbi:hypothetical protein G3M58_36865 [Streptomyces sp. SID7499]|uniref:Uncharacterized protein n=1 Tax=Streptomyces sp. SID7499 TaxID=2706086 RepID=A0A6G3X2I8_9ACTN|nr:hypothetical protein [Streptomyces sp. SID7499]